MKLKDLPAELKKLAKRRTLDQGRSWHEDMSIAALFTYDETPEGFDFWNRVDFSEDMTSHPMYPHSQNKVNNTYSIF